jgi:hypothetical protein
MIRDIKKRDWPEIYPKIPFKNLEFIIKDCHEFIKPNINRTMPDDNSLSDIVSEIIKSC